MRADNVNKLDREFFEIAGAGKEGSHVVITNSTPYIAKEGEYVYLIETYSEDAKFDSLKEKGKDVDLTRLDAGGSGYPERAFIPGRFSYIKPNSASVVSGLIIKV